MLTLLDIIKRTTDFFEKHGIESARLNAELIVAHALRMNRMKVYLQFERPLTEPELAAIRPLVKRRAAREPLAYVLGTAAFADLTLKVDRRVLIPRPETEQLVEIIKDTLTAAPASVLDLGTGSGALAIALARLYPESRVIALDTSKDALELARENAADCGVGERVSFLQSDWFSAVAPGSRFDVIVANPPYLTAGEVAAAEPEVRDHEPTQALVAPDAGCADLLRIIAAVPAFLAPGGYLFLETGIDQHPRLLAAMSAAGLREPGSIADWSGRNRFVSARG